MLQFDMASVSMWGNGYYSGVLVDSLLSSPLTLLVVTLLMVVLWRKVMADKSDSADFRSRAHLMTAVFHHSSVDDTEATACGAKRTPNMYLSTERKRSKSRGKTKRTKTKKSVVVQESQSRSSKVAPDSPPSRSATSKTPKRGKSYKVPSPSAWAEDDA